MSKSCFQILSTLAFVLNLSLLVGCTSMDRHVFVSTASRPITVTVVDQLSEQPLWSLDVPAGDALVLKVNTGGDGSAARTMSWSTYQASSVAGGNAYFLAPPKSSDSVDLGAKVRIDVSYRPAGEEPAVETAPIPTFEVEEPVVEGDDADQAPATQADETAEEIVEEATPEAQAIEQVTDQVEETATETEEVEQAPETPATEVEDVIAEVEEVVAQQETVVEEAEPTK